MSVMGLLGPLGMSVMAGTSWTHIASSNSDNRAYNPLPAVHPPLPPIPPHLSPACLPTPLYVPIVILKWL